MLDNGMFFIVFDSFDEISSVLDVDDSSRLIEALSKVIERFFFTDGNLRGIIASRYFRRPRFNLDKGVCTLAIRPFSERKIATAFRNYEYISRTVINNMFATRNGLIPLARNPFSAGLIVDFLRQPGQRLPDTQSEIYGSYIERRLATVSDILAENGVSRDEVVECATAIAGLMFSTPNVGLEVGVIELERRLSGFKVPEVVEVLVAARIGRRGGIARGRFSFVHRRFNEYFFVRYLLQIGGVVELDAIPLDSKWRDALVLYAEVCDRREALRIANFCWEEMKAAKLGPDSPEKDYLRHVHCLRYLNDAFHSRVEILSEIQKELFEHISDVITQNNSLLVKKIAIESVGLLRQEQIENIIIAALSQNNEWLGETAFKACRYTPGLSSAVLARLGAYLAHFDILELAARFRELRFSLQLAPALAPLRAVWLMRALDAMLYCFGIFVFFLTDLLGFGLAILSVLVIGVMIQATETRERVFPSVFANIWSFTPLRACFLMVCVASALSPLVNFIFHFLPGVGVIGTTSANRFFVVRSLANHRASVCAFLIICVFPTYSVYFQRQKYAEWLKGVRLRRITAFVIPTIAMMGIFTILLIFISYLADMLIGRIILGTFFGMIGLALVVTLGIVARKLLQNWFSDRNLMSERLGLGGITRAELQTILEGLKFEKSRLKISEILQAEGIQPNGTWIRGITPNLGGGASGTLLAKLDARWLGIER